MIINEKEIYSKLEQINKNVKEQLRKKGIIVPVKTKSGTIKVGRYYIQKNSGFYEIADYTNEIIVKQINLPQSAALLANKLALGKFIDSTILEADRKYGHAAFEQELQERLAKKYMKKDLNYVSLLLNKAGVNKLKKDHYRSVIQTGFEKLIKVA